MSEAELLELVEYWQEALRLRDWDIKIRYAYQAEIPESYAQNWIDVMKKRCIIKISYPEEHGELEYDYDPEQYILHELIELHFAPFKIAEEGEDDSKHVAQEQAIDFLADAILKLKRQGDDKSCDDTTVASAVAGVTSFAEQRRLAAQQVKRNGTSEEPF